MVSHAQCADLNLYQFSKRLQFTAAPLSGWTRVAAVWSRDFTITTGGMKSRKSYRFNEPAVFILSSAVDLEVAGKGDGFLFEMDKALGARLLENEFTEHSPLPFMKFPAVDDPPLMFVQTQAFADAKDCPLFDALRRFATALSGTDRADRGLRELCLAEFFLRLWSWNRKDTGEMIGKASFASVWTIRDVAAYIDTHFEDQFSLEDLAGRCRLNPSYFSLCFKQEMGIPLFEYINQARIKKACSLLKNTKRPVTEIAFEVGYNNITFFNRYFKRIAGMTPREYRR
ncbi:MAG: helix-turn-helix transcriptional regulator [Spirochaetales bacterium]|nr:helix-turn-helix transcriptional regulator [Spirochaetales bacterium]